MHSPAKLPTFSAHPPPCLPSLEPAVRTQALTHHSARVGGGGPAQANGFENEAAFVDNERLEFVGDAILYALAAELLYREFPRLTQGYLSKLRSALVTNELLAHWCTLYGLDRDLALSPPYEHLRRSTKVRGDTFEAYVAAVRMYRGSEICTTWLFALMRPYAIELFEFYRRQAELSPARASPSSSNHHQHGRKRSLSAAATLALPGGPAPPPAQQQQQQRASATPPPASPAPAALYDVADPFWVGSAPSLPPPAISSGTSDEGASPPPPSPSRSGTGRDEEDAAEDERRVQLVRKPKVRILGVPIPFIRRRTASMPGVAFPAGGPQQQVEKGSPSSPKLLRFRRWSRASPPAAAALPSTTPEGSSSSSRNSSENAGGSAGACGALRPDNSSSCPSVADTPPSSVAGGSTDALGGGAGSGSPLSTPTKARQPYPLLVTGSSPLKHAHAPSPASSTSSSPSPVGGSPTADAAAAQRQRDAELALASLGLQVPPPLSPESAPRALFLENPVSFLHQTYNGRGAHHRRVHYVEVHRLPASGPGRPQWEVSVCVDGRKVAEARADQRKDAKTLAAEAAIRSLGLDEGGGSLPAAAVQGTAQSPHAARGLPVFASGDLSPLALVPSSAATATVTRTFGEYEDEQQQQQQHVHAPSTRRARHLHSDGPIPPNRDEPGVFFLSSQSGSQGAPSFHLWIMHVDVCVGYGQAGRKADAESGARRDWAATRALGRPNTTSLPAISFRGLAPLPRPHPRHPHSAPGRGHNRTLDAYQVLCHIFFLSERHPRLVFVEVPPAATPAVAQLWTVTIMVDGVRRGGAEDARRSAARSRASEEVLVWLGEIQAR